MNMLWHELTAYRKSTLIWAASLAGIIIVLLAMYPTFADNAAEIDKLLQGYPQAFRDALGLSLSLSSLNAYYSFVLVYVLLAGGIQAMNLGLSLLSKETRAKTADFLLTKPVTRIQIITAKLLAALTSLLATNAIYLATAIIMASLVSTDYDAKVFWLMSLTLLFIQLVFMAAGMLISVFIRRIRSVVSISLGIVFAFFIISMLDSSVGDKSARYLSPFEYFDRTYIMENAGYETSYILLSTGIIVVAIALSYFVYQRQDTL